MNVLAQRETYAVREDAASTPVKGQPAPDAVTTAGWVSVAAALGGAAGIAGAIYTVGGIVMWLRFDGAGVQADQAIGVVPQQTIFSVGARQLLLPVVTVGVTASFAYWMEVRGAKKQEPPAQEDPGPRSQVRQWLDRVWNRLSPLRGAISRAGRRIGESRLLTQLGSAVGALLGALLLPVRWYFRWVPQILWVLLPLVLISPDPVGTLILLGVSVQGAAAVVEWAWELPTRRRRIAGLAMGLGVVTITSGLLTAWHEPKPLPQARVQPVHGRSFTAGYVAIDGGEAYLVRSRQLVVAPTTSIVSLTITKPPPEPDREGPALIRRVF